MSSGSNRILIGLGRAALLCAVWQHFSPAAALSQTSVSPLAVVRPDVPGAKRTREPRKATSVVHRQASARKGGNPGRDGATRRGAARAAQFASGARKPSGSENALQSGTEPTEKADSKEATPSETSQPERSESRVRTSRSELENIARIYCSNNVPNAIDARVAWESKRLKELEVEVSKKSEALAALGQEARTWVEKREKVWMLARDGLVEIYAKMRPEVAAQQLGAMSEESAASIITRLNPRSASAILNEMSSEKAARLADGVLRGLKEKSGQEKSGS